MEPTEIADEDYEGRDLEAMSFAVGYTSWILGEFGSDIHGKVLEVGAGCGNLTRELLKLDIDSLVALEPAPSMFARLEENTTGLNNVTAIQGYSGDLDDSYLGTFDTLVYINVLEHVQEDDEELRRAFQLLRPGGTLCVFVPALPALFSDFDAQVGHYRRYQLNPLRQQVEAAGFTTRVSRYFDILGMPLYYVHFTLLGRPMTAGNVKVFDRMVVPIARILEGLLPIPIGKNIILSAKRGS